MTGAPMTERKVCTIRGVHASVIDIMRPHE
nr:MAG TPA: hypothetical protein [Caudoviricetes sp.]